MSWWTSFKEKLAPKGLTPGVLVGDRFQKYVVCSIIIPIFFVVVTITKISLLPPTSRDGIIFYVDFLWPPFSSQFSEIARISGEQAAANYLIFFLILFVSYIGLVISTMNHYSRIRRTVSDPQISDAVLLIIFLIGWAYAIFLDYPKLYPKPLHNFYVDAFGLYFFRQWFVFVGAGLTPLLLLVTMRKVIDNLLMRGGQGSKP
jgi:hypothetical protein